MKPLRLAAFSITATALLASVSSCKSDQNPFDILVNPVSGSETPMAKIRLALDVAATRAEDAMSTAEEKKVTKVSVYVFDDHNLLEKFKTDISLTAGSPAELEVTPGVKTVYAIASKPMSASVTTGITLQKFEESVFSSTLSDLKTSDGLVMVGKSEPQQVLKSANENEVPTSNVFNIELVRLLAKTQVKWSTSLDASDFGFSITNAEFRVSQTCDKMRLVANHTTDIQASYKDTSGDGTYDGYSVGTNLDFIEAATTTFTADKCHYVTENIVQKPVAGNTTFVSLKMQFNPRNFYTYDQTTKKLTTTPNTSSGISFYAVGVVDDTYGFEDFALDPESHHVIVFETQQEADKYKQDLNGGNASAITVSEADAPLRAPAAETADVNHREFQTVTFLTGNAYYRINICTGSGNMKVERNRFYKIDVKSVSNLGFHSEDLLRPKDPSSDPGNSTSAWIEAVLTVAPWEETNQDANL